ncbi:MAG: hypothetical protein LKI42_02840 [Bacteroidales bacterium]|nr:hypothetical protein [Bacteroidales bacterium]MCI1784834.1 hypothetical protein [Bacteroidales bacterium]
MKGNRRTVPVVFLLALFMWYWASITLFPHAHVIDGVVVVHSHPFHTPNETHSEKQLETIFALTIFQSSCLQVFPAALAPVWVILRIFYIAIIENVLSINYYFSSPRSPPSVF